MKVSDLVSLMDDVRNGDDRSRLLVADIRRVCAFKEPAMRALFNQAYRVRPDGLFKLTGKRNKMFGVRKQRPGDESRVAEEMSRAHTRIQSEKTFAMKVGVSGAARLGIENLRPSFKAHLIESELKALQDHFNQRRAV